MITSITPEPVRLVAFPGRRALGVAVALYTHSAEWLEPRYALRLTFVFLDRRGRVAFRLPPDAEEDAHRVLLADLSELDACRAAYAICNSGDVATMRFFRSFNFASLLFPSTRFKHGWEGFDGHADAAAALAHESFGCATTHVAVSATSIRKRDAVVVDYDALARPIVTQFGRADAQGWLPSAA